MSYESPAKVPSTRKNNFMQSAPRLVSRRCHIRDFDMFIPLGIKAGFHMIADDRRRSRIANRRSYCRRSRRELFPYNRGRSRTIAEPSSAYISVSGSVFPYDCRRSQNYLRSAIRDPRWSAIIWKPAFRASDRLRCRAFFFPPTTPLLFFVH